MFGFIVFIFHKVAALGAWVGYAATAVVATTAIGGTVVLLSFSGIGGPNTESQSILPFTFKPSSLGTLDQIYGSLTAGAAAAFTGAGIQLDPIILTGKIAAVSNRIIAEAQNDKAALQRLSDEANKITGFKPSDDTKPPAGVLTTTPTPVLVGSPTAATTAAAGAAVASATVTVTPVRTVTATASVFATASTTATPTQPATQTPTVTATATPTETSTPTPVVFGCLSMSAPAPLLSFSSTAPGTGVSVGAYAQNVCPAGTPVAIYVTTTCTSGCNALWTDTTNGLQLAIDKGSIRTTNNPTQANGTQLYSGPVQVSNQSIGTIPSGGNSTLAFTVYLPGGATPSNLGNLTPSPANALQGLSITVSFKFDAVS